jgi:hypothetical protein
MRYLIIPLLFFIGATLSNAQIHEVEIVNPSRSVLLPFTNVGEDAITVLQLQEQGRKSSEYKAIVHTLNTKEKQQTIQVLPKGIDYSNSSIFNHFYHDNQFFFLEKSTQKRSKWSIRLSSLSRNPSDQPIVFDVILFKKTERLIAHIIKDKTAFVFTINKRKNTFNIYQLTTDGKVQQQSIKLEREYIKLINENYGTNIAMIDYDGYNSPFDMIQGVKVYMNKDNKIQLAFDIGVPYQYYTHLFNIDFPSKVSDQKFPTRKEVDVANYHTSLINNDLHIIMSTQTDVIYEVLDITTGKKIHRDRDNQLSRKLSIGSSSAAIRAGENVYKTGEVGRIIEKMISFSPFILPEKHQDTTLIYLGAVNSFFKNAQIEDGWTLDGTGGSRKQFTRKRDEPEGSFIIMESSFSIDRKTVRNKAREMQTPRIWEYGSYEKIFPNTNIYRFQGEYYCSYYNSGRKAYSFVKL